MPGLLDQFLTKQADVPVLSYSMQGKLYASSSGWILLSVPNSLVRGVFDAMHEPGIELPLKDGVLNAHISVFTSDEVEKIGLKNITERGHSVPYTLGPIKTVVPRNWREVSRVWYCTVESSQLKQIRKSYGLSPLPGGNRDFHITVAVRKTNVLKDNDIKKNATTIVNGFKGIQLLEGHEEQVLESKQSGMEELRGQGHYGLQEMAGGLSEFHGRYGAVPSRMLPGQDGQFSGIQSEQLPLGHKKTAESQQEEQSLDCLSGQGAHSFGSSPKESSAPSPGIISPKSWLERRRGSDDEALGQEEKLKIIYPGWHNKVPSGVGQGSWDFFGDNFQKIKERGAICRSNKQSGFQDQVKVSEVSRRRDDCGGMGQRNWDISKVIELATALRMECRKSAEYREGCSTENYALGETKWGEDALKESSGYFAKSSSNFALSHEEGDRNFIKKPLPANLPQGEDYGRVVQIDRSPSVNHLRQNKKGVEPGGSGEGLDLGISLVLQSPIKPSTISQLQKAYEANQKNDYATKTSILRELMDESPDDWIVDDPVGRNWGVTHGPTNFRFHMPPASIPESVRGPAVKRAWDELVKEAEDHELLKIAEDTPGIPDREQYGDLMKLRTGQIYTLLSQMHEAQKAGPHHDLRIGDKDTGLFSWASRKGLPQPGQKHLGIQQPVYSWDYKDFEGDIESGYGAGKVKKEFERPITITSIDENKISFSTADGKHPERFNMVKTPQGWLMVNSTPTQPTPYQKLHYHKIPAGEVESILQNFEPGTSFQAKIDGASSLVSLAQHGVDLLSYRSSRQTGRPIVHTERVWGGTRPKLDIPPELVGSVLKGELYGTRDGKAIPPSELGGILNAGIGRSLEKQKEQGVKLQNALFDIQQYDGKPVDFNQVPYAERRKMLQKILQHLPQDVFHLSPEATTPEEAREMWKKIQGGSLPISSEGAVIHPPHGKPIKSKLTEDSDVWIHGVFPGAGKYQDNAAGGFKYSLEPHGPPVGKVGTGFSDDIRRQMWENPNDWIGRVAKIRSQQQLPSGAYRAPAFISLHEDITGEPAEKMAEVGKHHNTADSNYDKEQLDKGVEIEHEHTDDSATAKEVAKDHLSEFPTYYTALTEMEDKLKAKEAGMPIYQRAFNAQLYRPIWNSEQSTMYNLADNLKGWHAKGEQMAREQANTEAFEDSMNPQQGWDRLRRRLSGQEPLGPEDPWDQVLFT